MTTFKADPFPGTDYTRYQQWEKVVLPSGEIWYVVPGHPGYVFDPVTSNATGKKVFRQNPKAQIDTEQAKKDADKKLQDQQAYNQSPAGQYTPIVLGTGATVASAALINNWAKGPATLQSFDPKTGISAFSDGTVKNAAGQIISGPSTTPVVPGATAPVTGAAAPTVTTTPAGAAAQGATGGGVAPTLPQTDAAGNLVTPAGNGLMTPGTGAVKVFPVGEAAMPDGSPGTLMSNKTIVSNSTGEVATPAPSGVGYNLNTGLAVVQTGAGLYQVYTSAKDFNKDKIGGSLGVLSGAATTLSTTGLGPSGLNVVGPTTAGYADTAMPYLMTAKGAYDAAKAFGHGGEGIRTAGTELGAGIGTFIAPGLGTVIGGVAGNAAGYALDRFAPGIFHKTTRQVAMGHTDDLLEAAKEDKVATDYIQNIRAQYNTAPTSDKVFAGKYKSWEEYQKAGLIAADLSGVHGNLKTYGPQWAHLTEDQRQQITQANINSGLYDSKKGEVEITDATQAKKNYDDVLKGFKVPIGTQAASTAPVVVAPGAAPPVVVAPNVIKAPAPLAAGQSPQAVAAAAGAGTTPVVPIVPVRTNTRSPGIDMSGRRIAY